MIVLCWGYELTRPCRTIFPMRKECGLVVVDEKNCLLSSSIEYVRLIRMVSFSSSIKTLPRPT